MLVALDVVVQPPSIDFVFSPKAADNLYYGETYNITYQASNGVALVGPMPA